MKTMLECELCGMWFQHGPHRYDGRFLKHYELLLCQSCFNSNWDGFAPRYEGKLVAHLKARSIPIPARNAKGLYPRKPE